MGKITLLVSREEMLHQAHNILQEKTYEIGEMKVIRTEDAVAEARGAIAEGAAIIIARGLQASLIKQYTDIPVVEIRLTAQEMGLLIVKAKQIVKKHKPVIAVVGFKNMFCDMSYFDMIYDIELRSYYASHGLQLKDVVQKAIKEDVDLIIGGETAVEKAKEEGLPSLFLSITEDSLRNAFSMAESMNYAMKVEKKNAAQMEAILDYSFNGVIKMDGAGVITAINPLMADILGMEESRLAGRKILDILPDMDKEAMKQVTEGGRDYALIMQINGTSVFAVFAPVLVDDRVDGVILTCHRVKKKQVTEMQGVNNPHLNAPNALAQFGDITQLSRSMQDCLRQARLFSVSEKPVVIMGEVGTEKQLIAQAIHNSSLHMDGPFIKISCVGLSDEDQRILVFGEKGAAVQAEGGSLLIQNIGQMTTSNQYKLYELIRHHICFCTDATRSRKLDVRIMVTTDVPLELLITQCGFLKELYYLLSGLVIQVPPLRKRLEDLKLKIEECIKETSERHSRYHVLTAGAWKSLMTYHWIGNILQVESFCERLVLTASCRSIDEIAVNRLLRDMYPDMGKCYGDGIDQIHDRVMPTYISVQAEKIIKTLAEFDGNREKTAGKLGISKSTLWRHMKKYEIE